VPLAAGRLQPRAVCVVHDEGAVNNAEQFHDSRGRLPFRDGSFDLVVNRHEAFVASEVARVLQPEGRLLTQQASSAHDQFQVLLGWRPSPRAAVDLDLFVAQVVGAGLVVEDAGTGTEVTRFEDIGALAWYLRMVPWVVPGFDVVTHRDALEAVAAHDLVVYKERLWLRCRK
jgi:SAM-dependent methyltransferase